MEAHHRKIDLQSPADLTYLLNNIKVAAKEKLDLAIPPSAAPEGEDAYRSKVEDLVQEYILQTLELALPSLTINGFDPSRSLLRSDSIFEPAADNDDGNYEPYDPRLADRLRTLYADFETQSTRVAELRRDAPGAAARSYMERLEEELLREKKAEANRRMRSEEMSEDLPDFGTLERISDVKRAWQRSSAGSVGLGQVSGVLAKLQRAEKAVEVLEAL